MKKIDIDSLPKKIKDLILERNRLTHEDKFDEADKVRQVLQKGNIILVDDKDNTQVFASETQEKNQGQKYNHLLALFGSGETSSIGRKIHEYLIKDLLPPVKIALLETPAGFETNPDHWYIKLENTLKIGLINYQPKITRIRAFRKDGEQNTNNPEFAENIKDAHYIHAGAGSPSYAIRHLTDSLIYKNLKEQVQKGIPASFASAAAIALGKFSIPVYEIYKAGEELHWLDGMDFFSDYGLNLTVIPHWNNNEGGEDVDTSRCFMGKKRFGRLLEILPGSTTILGIDEQTACVFDTQKKKAYIMGTGNAIIIQGRKQTVFKKDSNLTFSQLA